MRTSNHKNIFVKDYPPNWSGEVFVKKKFKIQCRGHMLLAYVNLNGQEIVETFNKKEFQKKSGTKFRVGKIIKKKNGNKMYAKWKGYNNSCNR